MSERDDFIQVDSVLPADGKRPVTLGRKLPLSRRPAQEKCKDGG